MKIFLLVAALDFLDGWTCHLYGSSSLDPEWATGFFKVDVMLEPRKGADSVGRLGPDHFPCDLHCSSNHHKDHNHDDQHDQI